MADRLPLLPTTVVGSYALPSWIYASDDWVQRGLFGPTDLKERDDDAVNVAILDQQRAGIDVITDGEMRRRLFLHTFIGRMTGIRKQNRRRRGQQRPDARRLATRRAILYWYWRGAHRRAVSDSTTEKSRTCSGWIGWDSSSSRWSSSSWSRIAASLGLPLTVQPVRSELPWCGSSAAP